ncbi:MAG TPA: hypothetical protein VFG20_02105 [Planctomycetaceae bacterium]|nr:hypothetical protein [Planctomycetaceae bacterium]
MRFHDAAISLQPRSIGSCLDVALVFVGQHLALCLQILAYIALPACVGVYFASRFTQLGWFWCLLAVGVMSIPLGTALVSAAVRTAVGQPCTAPAAIANAFRSTWQTMFIVAILRPVHLALMFAGVLPGAAVMIYTGFHAESRLFSRWRAGEHDHRIGDLVKLEFGDLLTRGLGIAMFGLLFWGLLTITVDATAMLLLGVSPCLGRLFEAVRNPWGLADFEAWWHAFWTFVTTDAMALTTITATALITYAVCRLAWFFAYVDLRIRRDCWDVEVALAEEAQRWRSPV